MSNRDQRLLLIIVVVALAVGYGVYKWLHQETAEEVTEVTEPEEIFNYDPNGPCPGETVSLKMRDPYMKGLIEQGEKYELILNYYKCNKPQIGDAVAYLPPGQKIPIVKIIRALEGDQYDLKYNPKQKSWNISVNKKMLMFNQEPYFFGAPSKPTLSLYLKDRPKGLLKDEMIIFSNYPPGSRDSGIFGIYSTNSLIGKVVIPKKN